MPYPAVKTTLPAWATPTEQPGVWVLKEEKILSTSGCWAREMRAESRRRRRIGMIAHDIRFCLGSGKETFIEKQDGAVGSALPYEIGF